MNVSQQLSLLKRLPVNELRERYAQLYDEWTNVKNRPWLIKKILYRMQCAEEGDISDRARKRALEIANDADLRLSAPKSKSIASLTSVLHTGHDRRLPPVGNTISRQYKGETLEVVILHDGFEYEGEHYKSLSSVAKRITGSHCNGYHFFGLSKREVTHA
jgi:hypothetical protein